MHQFAGTTVAEGDPMLPNVASTRSVPEVIARRMLPTIRRIASQLARRLPRHVRVDDLVSAGCQGLCAALERFDPARVEGFEAYAEARIRGAMLDELRASDPLSRDQRLRAKRIASAAHTLQVRLGRAAAADEIARELGIDLESFWAWQSASATHLASAPSGEGDADPVAELSDSRAEPADERLYRLERDHAMRHAIASLPERLRRVVALHYEEGLTLRRIGQELGVSESRVCQLEAEAMRLIREQCSGQIRGECAMAA